MLIDMLTISVFLSAFMWGIRAGFVGALIGLAVGIGAGFVFRSGVPKIIKCVKWMPRWLQVVGWIPLLMWPILCALYAILLTKLLLTVIY